MGPYLHPSFLRSLPYLTYLIFSTGLAMVISMINPAIDYQVYERLSKVVLSARPDLKGDVRNLSSLAVFFLGRVALTLTPTLTQHVHDN